MLGLGQRTIACPQCATEADRTAVWCGWCGARLAPAELVDEPPGDRPQRTLPEPGATDGTSGRVLRAVSVAGVLALLVAVLVVARPAPVPESLVGRLDVGAGPSATLPPAPGLGIAWRQAVDAPGDDPWFVGASGPPVVRGGRAVVGGVVVDLATGGLLADLRGAPLYGRWDAEGHAATLWGDTMEVADVVTGEVLSRVRVDAATAAQGVANLEPSAAARGKDTTLFTGWGATPDNPEVPPTWVLVADDGSVVASGLGYAQGWNWVTPPSTTHAVVSLPVDPRADPAAPGPERWSIIDLATGQEALRVTPEGERWQPPQVVGHHALVAQVPRAPDVPGQSPVWDVTLHDLAANRVVWEVELSADEGPVLHAVTEDGRGIVARRLGSVLRVDVQDVAALVTPEATVWSDGPSSAGQVAATPDVVVMLDPAADALVATDVDGTRRWRRPVHPLPDEGWVHLDVAGDLVVFGVEDVDGPRLRLIDVGDGRVVGEVTPGRPEYRDGQTPTIHSSVDGLVAIARTGHASWAPPPNLAALDWFEVRNGRRQGHEEVLEPWLRGVSVPEEMRRADGRPDAVRLLPARLSGTLRTDDGVVRPLVVGLEEDGRLDLLVGGGDHTLMELPAAATGPRHARDHVVHAVTGQALVLGATGGDGLPLTVVVDRASGAGEVLPSTRPLGVAGDVVLGQYEPGDGTSELVAHDLADGAVRWRSPWTWGGAVAADDDQVVVLQGSRLTARRPGDGSNLWSTQLRHLAAGPVVLTERSVLLATPYGDVVAVDRTDGTELWRRRVGGLVAALGAAGDHALVGTRDGVLVQLNAAGDQVQQVVVGSAPVTGVASLGPTVVAVVGQEVVGLRTDGIGVTRRDEVPLP